MAVRTGLEPATSAVTGQRSNQLNYRTGLRSKRAYNTACPDRSASRLRASTCSLPEDPRAPSHRSREHAACTLRWPAPSTTDTSRRATRDRRRVGTRRRGSRLRAGDKIGSFRSAALRGARHRRSLAPDGVGVPARRGRRSLHSSQLRRRQRRQTRQQCWHRPHRRRQGAWTRRAPRPRRLRSG